MAGSSSRLPALLLASILILSTAVPAIKCQETDEFEDEIILTGENIAKEVVQTAAEEEAPTGEEAITLRSYPGIDVACVFPKYDVKLPVIPAGSPADVVVGLLNGGDTDVKVLSLDVKLVHPLDYTMVVQNFSLQEFEAVIPLGAQASFPITFTPDKNFQPRDFGFTGIISYEVSGEGFGSIFYNGTIEIIEPVGYVSGEFIFLVLLGLSLFGLFTVWVSSQVKALSKKSKSTKKLDPADKDDESKQDEWLQDTNYYTHLKRTVKSKPKAKSKD